MYKHFSTTRHPFSKFTHTNSYTENVYDLCSLTNNRKDLCVTITCLASLK